ELTSDDLSDPETEEHMVAAILAERVSVSSDTSAEDLIANMTFRNGSRVLTELVNGDGEADDLAAVPAIIKGLRPSEAAAFLEYMDDNDIIAILQDFEVAKIVDIYMQMWSGDGDQAIAELIETERSSPSDAPSGQPDYTYASTPDIGLIADGETYSEKIAIQLPDGTWSYGTGEEITITKTNPDTGEAYDTVQPVLVANVKGIDGFLTEGLRRIVPIETERGLNYMLVHSNGDIIPEIIVVPPSDPADANASWLALAAQEADVTAETTEILTDPVVDDILYIRNYDTVGEFEEPEEVFNARRLATTVVEQYGPEEGLDAFVPQETPNPLTPLRNFLEGMDETQLQSYDSINRIWNMLNNLSPSQSWQLEYKYKVKIAHITSEYTKNSGLGINTILKHFQMGAMNIMFSTKPDGTPGIPAPNNITRKMKKIRSNLLADFQKHKILTKMKEWDELSLDQREAGLSDMQNLIIDTIIPMMSKAYDVPIFEKIQFKDVLYPKQMEMINDPKTNSLQIKNQVLLERASYHILDELAHELMHAWQVNYLFTPYFNGTLKSGDPYYDYAALMIITKVAYNTLFKIDIDNNRPLYEKMWNERQATYQGAAFQMQVRDAMKNL
ncbi:MAG: hypothetical protein AAF228_14165, partial [Pseudomonadota bacterium]